MNGVVKRFFSDCVLQKCFHDLNFIETKMLQKYFHTKRRRFFPDVINLLFKSAYLMIIQCDRNVRKKKRKNFLSNWK